MPSALRQPVPPSFVAEPPIAIDISLHPRPNASRISWPVPYVEAASGSRSFSSTRVSPEASAISMTAVLPPGPSAVPESTMQYFAQTSLISGSFTFARTISPPHASQTASTVPSPPSATGTLTVSHSPKTSCAAFSRSSAVCLLVRLPLNESLANTSFIFLPVHDLSVHDVDGTSFHPALYILSCDGHDALPCLFRRP